MTIDRRRDGDLAVTDRSIELRRRKREIVHIIHNTTWVVESLGLVIVFVFQYVLCAKINPYICAHIVFIRNLISAMVLVPFTHLFNEQRTKIMVLEHGWGFAMKNALRFNIAARVAPESNRSARNPENNGNIVPGVAPESNLSVRIAENKSTGSKKLNVQMEIMRKYPKQECINLTLPSPEDSTKHKIINGSDTINKDENDLPNQVQTL